MAKVFWGTANFLWQAAFVGFLFLVGLFVYFSAGTFNSGGANHMAAFASTPFIALLGFLLGTSVAFTFLLGGRSLMADGANGGGNAPASTGGLGPGMDELLKKRKELQAAEKDLQDAREKIRKLQGDLDAERQKSYKAEQEKIGLADQIRRMIRPEEHQRLQQQVQQLTSQSVTLQAQIQRLTQEAADRAYFLQRKEVETERWKQMYENLRATGGAHAAINIPPDAPPSDPSDYQGEKDQHPHQKYIHPKGGAIPLAQAWQIIGASQRGRGHEDGKYREDDFDFRITREGLALVAIADGVGSKPYARYGARAAVQGIISSGSIADRDLSDVVKYTRQGNNDQRDVLVTGILQQAFTLAQQSVRARAQRDHYSPDDLHSTLLALLAIPYHRADGENRLFLATAQVGDGMVYYRVGANASLTQPWEPIEVAQTPGVNNQVQPLLQATKDDWQVHLHDIEPGGVVLAMTDGIADDLEMVPDPDNGLFGGVEDFYQRIKRGALDTNQPAAALQQFLTYRKRQSFDDRTLVCIYQAAGGK